MKDYYTEFVNLSLQQCTKEDYKYKSRVRKHNRAFKKIEILTNEISKLEEGQRIEILERLLFHEDSRVVTGAGAYCLQSGLLKDKALERLREIVLTETDPVLSFSAEMFLKVHFNLL